MDDRQRQALAGKKVAELQTMAVELGVSGKGLKKAQLIDAIIGSSTGSNGSGSTEASPHASGRPAGGEVQRPLRTEGQGFPGSPTASGNGAADLPQAAQTASRSEQGGSAGNIDREAAPALNGSGDPGGAPAARGPGTGTANEPGAAGSTRREVPPRHQFEARVDSEPRREQFRDRDRDRGRRRRGRGRERPDRQERSERPERQDRPSREPEVISEADLEPASGILDTLPEGYGFLRTSNYLPTQEDVYVSLSQVRRFQLRRGDEVVGMARKPKETEKYQALVRIDALNGRPPAESAGRPWFDKLTPLYPEERIRMELDDRPGEIAQRIIDLVAPIGKGQRGMIVSPPKAGKTTVMKQIANSIRANSPGCHLIVLLVDERPEEVTDMQRSVDGEIVYSTFDRPSDDHIQVTELTLDRAKRMVELGRDVVILLDGITRLSRAYNLATPASGRILSGGVDSTALYPPKRFFGAARNIEQGGSLTIIATALVETGSRMDEVIFEEFKGTGNWELKLDRRASEKRLFPAIDISSSGTRKEELLLTKEELSLVWKLRRVLHALDSGASLELLIDKMRSTKGNLQFLMEVSKQSPGD